MTKEKPYDIQQRTFQFGVEVVKLIGTLPRTLAAIEVSRQVIGSGTSAGENVEEADGAESRADFVHKMSIARKEARETQYWLRVIEAAHLGSDPACLAALIQESNELTRILSTIIVKARTNAAAPPPSKS